MRAIERLRQTFQDEFAGQPAVIARAPGRVNLIGEHTDYNDGFVLPVAIDREVLVASRRRPDAMVRLVAANFGRRTEFTLAEAHQPTRERWSQYERGVALMLLEAGYRLGGFDAVVAGDVPSGAGLSSSAAVEVATGTSLKALFELDVDPVRLALLCQRAENEVVGVNCGIMDQFVATLGKRDHALFLDCRSLETQHVPIQGPGRPGAAARAPMPGRGTGDSVLSQGPAQRAASSVPEVQIVVADTAVRRGLVDSEYNRRRAECEEAVRLLGQRLPDVRALRDVTLEQFQAHAAELPDVVRRRARHVISENGRVLASVAALTAGDLSTFGRLMNESHTSLRQDYEVTIPALDAMVAAARTVPGVLGSRMTGAGFGGCTVSLVQADAVPQFMREVPERYRAQTGLQPRLYVCRAMDGATIVG